MKKIVTILFLLLIAGCHNNEQPKESIFTQNRPAPSCLDLDEIQQGGEMIMLTVSGPDTYYDYNGVPMGLQYKLCEKYAESIGVRLRVEVATSTNELVQRLLKGEADIIAAEIPVTDSLGYSLTFCGCHTDSAKTVKSSWAVRNDSKVLAESLKRWYKPNMKQQQIDEDRRLRLAWENKRRNSFHFTPRSGQISPYDAIFKRESRTIGWDWRLLAAQGYQESGFNPKAISWAGACGVMQIMPSTAAQLGIKRDELFDAATNINGAVRYLKKLEKTFSSIPDPIQRCNFILAAYNGGANHIKDAQALTRKYGRNPNVWDGNVAEYVRLMSNPLYYKDPVVQHGYMRGSETYDYVIRIRQRWSAYSGRVR